MAAVQVKITGGDKLLKRLAEISQKLGGKGLVRVGFLEGATYPASAGAAKQGKKPSKKVPKGTTGLQVAQVAFWNEFGTSRAPPRPFFRDMIARESPQWGEKLARVAKAANYDAPVTLARMGEGIKGQLVKSIVDFTTPANAPYTVARKGFNKPLIDTGVMQRAVDFQVVAQ